MSDNPFEKLTNLDLQTKEKLLEYAKLLREFNAKVNMVSRKDLDDVEYRHIAFCASICEFFKPDKRARIADVGTGGGLPGIVLAILYPHCKITMFDGVGKKVAMVNEMIEALSLKNAKAINSRIEEYKGYFDYITGRAVCELPMFFGFVKKKINKGKSGNLNNGVIYFKGGDLEEVFYKKKIYPDISFDIAEFFDDERFAQKRIMSFSTEKVLRILR